MYFSNTDSSMRPKENSIPYWGADSILVNLPETGGYTTFAQDVEKHPIKTGALAYVHGVCTECLDTTNKYFRTNSRLRIGLSRRDFTVFVSRKSILIKTI